MIILNLVRKEKENKMERLLNPNDAQAPDKKSNSSINGKMII
jgi:hypothetical protein